MKISHKLESALAAFLFLFSSCTSKDSSIMKDGDYTGIGEGRAGEITLTISVTDNKVTDVKIIGEAESDFAKPAISQIGKQLTDGVPVENLDAVSGATLTSNGTIEALENAVKAAKGIAEKPKKYRNTKCDIVIIGSGGAGLSAAL